MGTNYYVRTEPSCGGKCETHCHGEEIHLGKASAGWTFTFRAYPDPSAAPDGVHEPVTDIKSWEKLLDLGVIINEYHREVQREEMLAIALDRPGATNGWQPLTGQWLDGQGCRFDPREFC